MYDTNVRFIPQVLYLFIVNNVNKFFYQYIALESIFHASILMKCTCHWTLTQVFHIVIYFSVADTLIIFLFY